MKTLTTYISEKANFLVKKHQPHKQYNYFPKTKEELQEIIDERLKIEGDYCDLGDIDVSKVTDMSYMFEESEFNGDISEWDVSNVTNMEGMFYHSKFNGDISQWNVSSVSNMEYMFSGSSFDGDISQWDVSNVIDIKDMFENCPIKKEYKPKFK